MNHQDAKDLICEALMLMGEKYSSPEAARIMLAIGYQESGFTTRNQIKGPARGFWQFEQKGGVLGVIRHPSTLREAHRVCKELGYSCGESDVYERLDRDDLLAACFARLLLWTLPGPIPTTEEEAWKYYLKAWRPGKPHRDRWIENWKKSGE